MSVTGSGSSAPTQTQIETAVVAGVNYENGQTVQLPEDGIYPGWKGVQTFTVELPQDFKDKEIKEGQYTVTLKYTVPEIFGTDVKVTVYKVTNPETDKVEVTQGEIQNNNGQLTRTDKLTYSGALAKSPGDGQEGTADNQYKVFEQALTGQSGEQTATIEENVTYNNQFQKTTYFVVYQYTDHEDQDKQMNQTFSAKVEVSVELAEE